MLPEKLIVNSSPGPKNIFSRRCDDATRIKRSFYIEKIVSKKRRNYIVKFIILNEFSLPYPRKILFLADLIHHSQSRLSTSVLILDSTDDLTESGRNLRYSSKSLTCAKELVIKKSKNKFS